MNFNYNLPMTKSDGCVLINAKDWQDNTTHILQAYNMKGEKSISYLNKVLKTNYNKDVYYEDVNEGDLIFITRQASRISYLKPFKIPNVIGDYANVHLLQVIGKFINNEVSVENFVPLYDKVFMKRVHVEGDSVFFQDTSSTTVGKVLKTGKGGFDDDWKRRPMNVKVGQTVLIRDNITTELMLGDETYIATDDNMIIGYFKDDIIDLEHLVLFDSNILLEEYEEEKISGSSLFKPVINLEKEDINELYKNNQFRVLLTGDKTKNINVNEKVLIERDMTNYITFLNKTYFIVKDDKNILAKFN